MRHILLTLLFVTLTAQTAFAQVKTRNTTEPLWSPRLGCVSTTACSDAATWTDGQHAIRAEWFGKAMVVHFYSGTTRQTVSINEEGKESISWHYPLNTRCWTGKGTKPCLLWIETKDTSRQLELRGQPWATRAVASYEKQTKEKLFP